MKVTLALSALVSMTATSQSDEFSQMAALLLMFNYDSDHKDSVNDLQAFELIVRDTTKSYRENPIAGTKKNNYRETRKSNDKLWSFEHGDMNTYVTLTAKRQKSLGLRNTVRVSPGKTM
ncbi:MAG: hypothetical protein J3R72DRAFT_487728 [Linnemannia gamsii]|nr:MAG: hypothetical protein J3R72DRAFT_487728 [Linnemannia gamsii]